MPITQFIKSKTNFQPGEVAFVGAGPGDAELLTLKALRMIQQAQVVIYDRLVSEEIMSLVPNDCHRIYVGKSTDKHSVSQDKINDTLVEWALKQKKVVRLKGGDSFIFGRGSEEINYLLHHQIASHIVPGITAASGATSYAGIPLTHRDIAHSCSFITGHFTASGELDLPWQNFNDSKQTLVFYMGVRSAKQICQGLIAHGRAITTPVAVIYKGTQSEQKVWRSTLADLPKMIANEDIKPPSLLVIGEVVNAIQSGELAEPAYIKPEESCMLQAASCRIRAAS